MLRNKKKMLLQRIRVFNILVFFERKGNEIRPRIIEEPD